MKEKIEAIIFDMDDTLIPNGEYYHLVKEQLSNLFLSDFGNHYTFDEIYNMISDNDLKSTQELGLSRDRFILSAIEVYYSLCEKHEYIPQFNAIKKIHQTASNVFDCVDKLGKIESKFLDSLTNLNIPIYLLTSGDKVVQSYKIYQSNIFEYIPKDNVHIVDKKTCDVYKSILSDKNLDNCIMIGNSKRSDILPALELNMWAIHIDVDTWAYEHAELPHKNKLFVVNNFKNVVNSFSAIRKIVEL